MSTEVVDRPLRSSNGALPHDVGTLARRPGRADAGAALAAVVAAAAWLPFLNRPLTSDEAGFLLLARQWHPGSSLYGDYWVDRPPLLLWLFSLAGHLGPTTTTAVGTVAPGVKLSGAAASGTAVLLTAVLASVVAPHARWSRRAAVVLAAVLLSSPLLGMPETDGEVLAVPFVLLGLACVVAALRAPSGPRAVGLAAMAGASAVAAALVKQNVIDVFVFAVVLAVVSRGRTSRLRVRLAGFAAGAAAVLGAAAVAAHVQGSSTRGLWDAVVVFRVEASGVIGSSASEATDQRLTKLVLAFVGSGVALVLLVAAATVLAPALLPRAGKVSGDKDLADPSSVLVWPTLGLVAWELAGIALGGSYWPHYLTGVVPGLVALVAIARPRTWPRRALTAALGYAAAASVAVWEPHAVAPVVASSSARVMTYLRDHAAATDGVVVGFGHPDIVAGSGLTSPYENLWSLPVRVRDPHLAELRDVLAGPDHPRWVVVAGDSLDSWGLDAVEAQDYLQHHYLQQVRYGDWHIWRLQEGGRQ